MWRFTLLDFPVAVHWQFWLMTALLGGGLDSSLPLLLLWVAIVFVSILGHELGHALAMRYFGDHRTQIILYSFGGLASGRPGRSRGQKLVISGAGPAFSAMLGLLGWGMEHVFPLDSFMVRAGFHFWMYVNIGWTLFNLLPVIPLDGGRISEALFGPARIAQALRLSMITAIVMAVIGLVGMGWWTALLFGMMAYANWQQLNGRTPPDLMRP